MSTRSLVARRLLVSVNLGTYSSAVKPMADDKIKTLTFHNYGFINVDASTLRFDWKSLRKVKQKQNRP